MDNEKWQNMTRKERRQYLRGEGYTPIEADRFRDWSQFSNIKTEVQETLDISDLSESDRRALWSKYSSYWNMRGKNKTKFKKENMDQRDQILEHRFRKKAIEVNKTYWKKLPTHERKAQRWGEWGKIHSVGYAFIFRRHILRRSLKESHHDLGMYIEQSPDIY